MTDLSPQTAPVSIDKKTRLKSILGGSAGNLVGWYDWYVYAAFTEPYRVCRRVNILRDYSDEKTKLYPRN